MDSQPGHRSIRVGCVNYLNTAPLLYGLCNHKVWEDIMLSTGFPSEVSRALLASEIDLGLIPVATLTELQQSYIQSAYGIACHGPVASVCLFSKVPLNNIKTVYLDYQSKTSVALVRILLKYHWKHRVQYIAATPGFESKIAEQTAAVVIGDRALQIAADMPFAYDLGEAWLQMTGLPFVFAAWVSQQPLPESFVQAFDEAQAYGLMHLQEVMKLHPFPYYDLHRYYTQNIHYTLGEDKRKGLELFLNFLKQEKQLLEPTYY